MLPHFVVIGAMKGGTTSLYHYLAGAHGLVAARGKETDFFASAGRFAKGVAWYDGLFSGSGRWAFEASPNYTKRHLFPGVPARMHSVVPGAKLIYVVRDPIARALSHYVHSVAAGDETRSFAEAAIRPDSNYVQTSRYHYQLEAFLEYYDADSILIVQSEALDADPAAAVNEICEFLRMPLEIDAAVLSRRFHESAVKMRPSSLERLLLRRSAPGLVRRVGSMVLKPLRIPIEKPLLVDADRDRLRSMLADDVEKLRRFSGKSFAIWSL